MIHLPAVLLSFFSGVFLSSSASACFEDILMTIIRKKNKNRKEIRGRAFVLPDSRKKKSNLPVEFSFVFWQCYAQGRRGIFKR